MAVREKETMSINAGDHAVVYIGCKMTFSEEDNIKFH